MAGRSVKRNNTQFESPPLKTTKKSDEADFDDDRLTGKPVPNEEARRRWPQRYDGSKDLQARCHYTQAIVDGCVYKLGDDVYVQGTDGNPNYIARIVELFESADKQPYFTGQWFYRAEDTVIKNQAEHVDIDKKQVFFSDVRDDNPLGCIVSKVKIIYIEPNVKLAAKKKKIESCDLYYQMKYLVPFSTFANIVKKNSKRDSDTSTISSDESSTNNESSFGTKKPELSLLDLYCGCGAMSTGLCFGAWLSGVKLTTRWAVDYNSYACESLKLNHPETEVRNEKAEDFLSLLKEWVNLCKNFSVAHLPKSTEEDEDEEEGNSPVPRGEFQVGKLVAICYGDPNKTKKSELHFKVRWKGYGPDDDTWEPIEGLSKCKDKIKEFVTRGYRSKILPLPGDVDFICGGPPCQGVSGFNRFRNGDAPLEDPKNRQLLVFMDIVQHLKPRYILMENVVDILKFSHGLLGRFALGRLIAMDYQARLGILAAGSYGLPQYRLRVFLWGACHEEKLPQYPFPTHDSIARGGTPTEFEDVTVVYDTKESKKLEKALLLGDAISDLPMVSNDESADERLYGIAARTDFQKCIKLRKCDMIGCSTTTVEKNTSQESKLYDHRPLKLSQDDFDRVCQIPKAKGANFRNLAGVLVNSDTKQVQWDQSIERVKLASGKHLVPDYAMSFMEGKSKKPFGRLWWDETVSTVVTRAQPHNQAILHPTQDRVLTVRENARLQGFPDWYKLCGPVKERYMQVGNAVAVPVALALGYTFGRACQELSDDDGPLITLPFSFPSCLALQKN